MGGGRVVPGEPAHRWCGDSVPPFGHSILVVPLGLVEGGDDRPVVSLFDDVEGDVLARAVEGCANGEAEVFADEDGGGQRNNGGRGGPFVTLTPC